MGGFRVWGPLAFAFAPCAPVHRRVNEFRIAHLGVAWHGMAPFAICIPPVRFFTMFVLTWIHSFTATLSLSSVKPGETCG